MAYFLVPAQLRCPYGFLSLSPSLSQKHTQVYTNTLTHSLLIFPLRNLIACVRICVCSTVCVRVYECMCAWPYAIRDRDHNRHQNENPYANFQSLLILSLRNWWSLRNYGCDWREWMCISASSEEPCMPAKKPRVSAKGPYISANKPCISAEETCISINHNHPFLFLVYVYFRKRALYFCKRAVYFCKRSPGDQ